MEELDDKSKERLEKRHEELVRIIKAFEGLSKNEDWNTLRELIFERAEKILERKILNESLSEVIDTNKIYRLQGEWAWAKHYNNTPKFIESLKLELDNINKKIK